MPIIYDDETGGNLVVLSPLLTIEEAVIVLLGRSLSDHPFVTYDEFGNHEATYVLEDYLQLFYDNGDEDLAKKGLAYHELLLDAIDGRKLNLHQNKIRANKLSTWAATNRIRLADDFLTSLAVVQKLIASNKLKRQEKAILDEIAKLGHDPLNLPPHSREGGVKKSVLSKLNGKDLFIGATVFKHAWDRLNKKGKIKYVARIKN